MMKKTPEITANFKKTHACMKQIKNQSTFFKKQRNFYSRRKTTMVIFSDALTVSGAFTSGPGVSITDLTGISPSGICTAKQVGLFGTLTPPWVIGISSATNRFGYLFVLNGYDASSQAQLRWDFSTAAPLDISNQYAFSVMVHGGPVTVQLFLRNFTPPSTFANYSFPGVTVTDLPVTFDLTTSPIPISGIVRMDLYLTNVTASSDTVPRTLSLITSLCFPAWTNVTMWDKSLKRIKDICPGDKVLTANDGSFKIVKRLLETPFRRADSIVYFPKGSLTYTNIDAHNDQEIEIVIPTQDLYSSPTHPFYYKNERRPANSFDGLNGIHRVRAGDVFDRIEGETESKDPTLVSLWNVQFDEESTFFVEGVLVQSHSPYHFLDGLPMDMRKDGDDEMRQTWDVLDKSVPQLLEDKLVNSK